MESIVRPTAQCQGPWRVTGGSLSPSSCSLSLCISISVVSLSLSLSLPLSPCPCLYLCLCPSRGQSSPYSLPQCPSSSLNPSTCLQLPILQLAGGSSLPNAPLSLTPHSLPLSAPLLKDSTQPCVVFQIPGKRNCLAASGQVSHLPGVAVATWTGPSRAWRLL